LPTAYGTAGRRALAMKFKAVTITLLLFLGLLFTIGYVSAASISATINATSGGSPVVDEPQGTTIQLECSFTINPSSTADGVVQYKYSTDGVTWGSKVTITTLPGWAGSLTTVDFTLANAGYYKFYLTVDSGDASATTYYPASGSFHSDPPPSVLPEAPPIAALAMGLAAIALFVTLMAKNGTAQSLALKV
jgi:hypothetical protein